MKAVRPHVSTLCGCIGCRHFDQAEIVGRMIGEGSCLGWHLLARILKEAGEGDAGQLEVWGFLEGMRDDWLSSGAFGSAPPCK